MGLQYANNTTRINNYQCEMVLAASVLFCYRQSDKTLAYEAAELRVKLRPLRQDEATFEWIPQHVKRTCCR